MSRAAHRVRVLQAFFPFLGWLARLRREDLRPDLEAGLIGAILILPQSIALAVLAGMPPEYGIYTSIVPVAIAALWGSSFHTLSGPNTAICVLLAASVAPFASIGTSEYIGYVLALTLMVGVIELLVGVLRVGSVLDFISQTVISGVVLAVGLMIIVSALPALLGVLSNLYEPFVVKLWQVGHDLARANPYALAVGGVTVVSGLLLRRIWRRYALVLAVLIGSLFGLAMNAWFGSAHTGVELLGRLSLAVLPLSLPTFNLESLNVLSQLLSSAFAIAFLGLMQTIVISRSLAMKSGQRIDTNQEFIGQGLSNIVAPFLSCFASSGSFNRSAAHHAAGARTPLAAVYASIMLALLVFAGAAVIVYLPMPVVAGALILVGIGLVDLKEIRRAFKARQEAAIFLVTFVSALGFGLNSGVFAGVLMSFFIYLWFASKPKLRVSKHFAQDGRDAYVITLDGNLFFGSVNHVEQRLDALIDQQGEGALLLLRTDHITYLDMPGVAMLAAQVRRCRERGSELYLYLAREDVAELIERSGLTDEIGRERLMHADHEHPMKQVFMPYSSAAGIMPVPVDRPAPPRQLPEIILRQQHSIMLGDDAELLRSVSECLHGERLLAGMPPEQLSELLAAHCLQVASRGSQLVARGDAFGSYLMLLSGELEVLHGAGEDAAVHRQELTSAYGERTLMPVSGDREWLTVQALSEVRYLLLDADALEHALGHSEHLVGISARHRGLRVSAFRLLPAQNLEAAYAKLQAREVAAGEIIIRQGDPGDAFYLVESGEAEVLRTDPFTQQTHYLDHIGPGESFGEDALLQDVTRNATVCMLSAGVLQVLTRADFDALLRANLVHELDATEARSRVEQGQARWLDCRFEMEYSRGHLRGATHLPLDLLRRRLDQLDRNTCYIVYCRSGQRSTAAAYVLRDAGFDAYNLRGGLHDWPDALEQVKD